MLFIFSICLSLQGLIRPSISPQSEYPEYWSSNRVYTYTAIYLDSAGKKISTERITLQPTGKVWDTDPNQTLMNFNLDSISAEWSKISTVPLNGIQRQWMTNYQEGVLQTPNKIWMHPLRQNQYILTELAPFPEIILPIKKDTTWNTTLWVYKAFGTFEGTIECTYTISEPEEREYRFGQLKCWKISATGIHNKLGKNTVTYYFNETYGFTEMNYLFFNHQTISLKLIHLKQ